ncbi:MAG: hypothetical protein M0011_06055 [Elusimicrobia bacterium]|nr:hypothetical protein [Elusimicrobiota bacterium]
MKKALAAVLALACAGVLLAKDQPAQQAPAAAQAKPAAAQTKAADEQEDSGVLIDSTKYDAEDSDVGTETPAYVGAGVPGGIPSSYGQCRGVMTEGGRSLLVFESLDDGAISLVQVTFGKTGVSWKLAGRIPRSGE